MARDDRESTRADELHATALAMAATTPYDFAAIAGFALDQDLHEQHRSICSAFVTRLCVEFGLFDPLPDGVEPHRVNPYAVLLMAAQRGRVQRILPAPPTAPVAAVAIAA